MELRPRHLASPKVVSIPWILMEMLRLLTIFELGRLGRVTVQNYYQFRHVEKPGWKLGWTWTRDEVIWSMSGAFATEQGNCSLFKFDTPHSCEESPVILDLMPEASPENRSEGCCRGGVLSARAVDPSKSFTSFEISVGSMDEDGHEQPPANEHGSQHVLTPCLWRTRHHSVVSHSQHFTIPPSHPALHAAVVAEKQTKALYHVSLDTRQEHPLSTTDSSNDLAAVQCSDHMCPVRVHWHVMTNYINHWRVKLTVSNYNYNRNYSNWNILMPLPDTFPMLPNGSSKQTLSILLLLAFLFW
ncbi:COBRA-like protein 2, partial [Cucurbita argyrosperma subsp. argyrosperma]